MIEDKPFTLHIKFFNQEKTLGEATLKEMGQPLCRIESIEDARYIRDTLNELYDENQELQSRIKYYDNALKRLQDLTERKLEENEQLKQDKTNLHRAMSRDRVKYNQFKDKVFCCIDTKIKLLKDCYMINEAKTLEDLQKEIGDLV